MYTVLLVIHVILTVAMIAIILLQRNSGDGLGGIGGGGGSGFMTGRAQANLLTRSTAVLATLFILNSLALSWLTQQNAPSRSIADKIVEEQAAEPEVPTPDGLQAQESAMPAAAEKDNIEVILDAEAPPSKKQDKVEQPSVPQPVE